MPLLDIKSQAAVIARILYAAFPGLRQADVSQGGSIVDSLPGAAGVQLSLSAGILEDCEAVDLQALGHLRNRDTAMAACTACILVRSSKDCLL